VKPTEVLARERTREGDELVLSRRDTVYHLTVDGEELMTSRAHGSEQDLARLACEALAENKAPRVLVGGLGFGYTLRAALDRLPPKAEVVVCEVFASLLEWNRGVLADLAGRPLQDRRVQAVQADVWTILDSREDRERFDAILLDVDNGPEAFTLRSNGRLYGPEGLARLRDSLNARGILAVWSSSDAPRFRDRLRKAGFEAWIQRVPSREGAAKRNHVIFLARRLDAGRRRT
jgi:spermidine synthase